MLHNTPPLNDNEHNMKQNMNSLTGNTGKHVTRPVTSDKRGGRKGGGGRKTGRELLLLKMGRMRSGPCLARC